jgi:hypothetical protein
MKWPHRKSTLHRTFDAVVDSLDGVDSIGRGLAGMTTKKKKELTAVVPGGARTAGAVAGAVASMTAASAGISAYRRRREGQSDDS